MLLITLFLPLVIQPDSIAHADGTGVEYWAVIVGVSDYLYQDDLYYAATDTTALYQQLAPVWGTDHIMLLTDQYATKGFIQYILVNWLAPREDANDVVLFYFDGHGGTDGSNYYIAPTDSSLYTWSSDISDYELSSWLSVLDSNNVVVILDNCDAGGFVTDLSSSSQAIMASSAASESSWSGIFTYYLMQTLANAGTADNNADYILTTQEIFTYTSPRVTQYVAQQWGESQHPVNYDSYPGGLALFTIAAIGSNVASGSIAVDGISCPSQSSCSVLMRPNSSRSITISSIVQPQTTGSILSRYVFVSWDDGNTQPTRTFYLGGQYTATYKTQYYLMVSSEPGSTYEVEWFDSGTSASTGTAQETITNGSTRYVFQHWNVDGVSVTGNPATVYMNEPHTVYASYKRQCYLSVSSEHGSVTGTGWYDYGATASTSAAQATITDGNTRYLFQHWVVDGVVKGTNPVTISMNAPHTATAEYKTQYYLDVQSKYSTPSGEGWYDSGTIAYASITPVVGTLIRHRFSGWSGDTGDDQPSTSIYMNQPKSIVATWKTDYLYLYLLIGGVLVGLMAVIAYALLPSKKQQLAGKEGIIPQEANSEWILEPEQTVDIHDGKETEKEHIRKIYSDKGQTKRENKNGIGVDSSSPDSQWLTKFNSIRSQADSILNKVTALASTGTEEELSEALNEAIEKLSILLKKMKETPLPSKKEYQKYKKDVLVGMELFIDGCLDNIEYFETREQRRLTECSANINMAYSKFNKADMWLAKAHE